MQTCQGDTEQAFWGRILTPGEVAVKDRALPGWKRVAAFDRGRCQRCNGDQDIALLPSQGQFGFPKPRRYCRQCIHMGRVLEGEDLYYFPDPNVRSSDLSASYMTWQGKLSPEQARASQALLESLEDFSRPHLVYAVTGAGKTEMIFQAIDQVLGQQGRVCICSPRVDVCVELYPRLQEAFAGLPVSLVHGNSNEAYRYTPLLVTTTHQLLRFKEAFDLLVVDEVDAFPYAGNEALHFAVQRAVKTQGKEVYLTATPSDYLLDQVARKKMTMTVLPARYHGHPLPEPSFFWLGNWRDSLKRKDSRSRLRQIIHQVRSLEGVHLIFMPSITTADALYAWLLEEGQVDQLDRVHSQDPDRQDKVQALRDGKLKTLITTSILERGVTFSQCHVLVLGAEDGIYSTPALVQMSGRVGRKKDYPTGQVIFAHFGQTAAMKKARQQIKDMNQMARKRGLVSS